MATASGVAGPQAGPSDKACHVAFKNIGQVLRRGRGNGLAAGARIAAGISPPQPAGRWHPGLAAAPTQVARAQGGA